MDFDFLFSNDSVASHDVHCKTTFFRGASGDLLSLAQFSIFCNENLGKYCSNVALLYGNWLNELTLSVSPKTILKNMRDRALKVPAYGLCIPEPFKL